MQEEWKNFYENAYLDDEIIILRKKIAETLFLKNKRVYTVLSFYGNDNIYQNEVVKIKEDNKLLKELNKNLEELLTKQDNLRMQNLL